ncbi:hypothetical protein KA478_05225 [Patescibacteria group bacterium]|nr:hypothetical protein [Patescibacteria group bacterium]
MCESRQVLLEDPSIQLTIRQPSAGQNVMGTTNVWYDVTSPKPITTIKILVNDANVAEYAYVSKTNLSDIKKITLPE